MAVRVCKIDGCAMKVYHCDLCSQHYHRWKKYGDPCAVPTVDVSKWLPKGSYKNNPREYRSWKNMIVRCTDSRHKKYEYYGGRGIKVCDRWLGKDGLANFIKDMGARPQDASLDRIDPDKDYCPENCRWATRDIQSYNCRTRKHSTTIKGVHICYHHGREWFVATISRGYKQKRKWCKTLEEAIAMRQKLEKEFYGC